MQTYFLNPTLKKVRIRPRRPSSTHLNNTSSSSSQPTSLQTPSSSLALSDEISNGVASYQNNVPSTPTKQEGGGSGTSTPLKTARQNAASLLLLTPSKLITATTSSITPTTPNNASAGGGGGGGGGAGLDEPPTASSTSATANRSTTFECNECNKKFVSYFGLVQHMEQHPTLSVTCSLCEITFEVHQALVAHNATVHSTVCEATSGDNNVEEKSSQLDEAVNGREKEK